MIAYNHIYSIFTSKVYMNQGMTPQLFYTLLQFTKQKKTSTYQICKLLENTPFACRYKNVWERVQILLSKGVIKEVSMPQAEHGAIYFTLTSEGIENIILYSWRENAENCYDELIKNYGSNQLFKMFAYKFFERHTLLNIRNELIHLNFREYFSQCVLALRNMRRDISEIKKKGLQPSHLKAVIASNEKSVPISQNYYLLHLIFSIIQDASSRQSYSEQAEAQRNHDMDLLANDKKFALLIPRFKDYMELSYDSFMKYSDNRREENKISDLT
jgi:hypothetical protein